MEQARLKANNRLLLLAASLITIIGLLNGAPVVRGAGGGNHGESYGIMIRTPPSCHHRQLPLAAAFLGKRKKNLVGGKYVPLLLFRGNDPKSRAIDKIVSKLIERDLDIPVARLNPNRDVRHRKLLERLEVPVGDDTNEKDGGGGKTLLSPVILYHRDSKQLLRVDGGGGMEVSKETLQEFAKGRAIYGRLTKEELKATLDEVDVGKRDRMDEGEEDLPEEDDYMSEFFGGPGEGNAAPGSQPATGDADGEEEDVDEEDMELVEKGRRAVERRTRRGGR